MKLLLRLWFFHCSGELRLALLLHSWALALLLEDKRERGSENLHTRNGEERELGGRNGKGAPTFGAREQMAGRSSGKERGRDKRGEEPREVQCAVELGEGGPSEALHGGAQRRTVVHGSLPRGSREEKGGGSGHGRQGKGLPRHGEQFPRGGRGGGMPHGELPCGTAAHGGRGPGPVRGPVRPGVRPPLSEAGPVRPPAPTQPGKQKGRG